MKFYRPLLTLILLLLISTSSFAGIGHFVPQTDRASEIRAVFGFFDLRERESFVQLTNLELDNQLYHVQIFNVGDNCNENNFFDLYTPSDTHIYNMRDILTNDGNPSGVVLPDNAYGIVVLTSVLNTNSIQDISDYFGNFRILDNAGYEYRTNLLPFVDGGNEATDLYNFNFNQEGGVVLSDIVGLIINTVPNTDSYEWDASNVLNTFIVYDVDIYDLNETPFSCRDVIFACVDEDNPLAEEILAVDPSQGSNGASVARFEYGINDAITHSRGGELLCPGNNIPEGFTTLRVQGRQLPGGGDFFIAGFVGLNNGNGRGSMGSLWQTNLFLSED